jgi:hypothetical protein
MSNRLLGQGRWDAMEPIDEPGMNGESEWEREYQAQFKRLVAGEQAEIVKNPGGLFALRLRWKVEDVIYKRRREEELDRQLEAGKWHGRRVADEY